MKSRLFKIVNFLAFNLLFFALYLNFVQRPNTSYPDNLPMPTATVAKQTVLKTVGQPAPAEKTARPLLAMP